MTACNECGTLVEMTWLVDGEKLCEDCANGHDDCDRHPCRVCTEKRIDEAEYFNEEPLWADYGQTEEDRKWQPKKS